MSRNGGPSLAEAFIAFWNEKTKATSSQGRFFSPKASDSCSAGFASPPGTPPRYEGPPASAFGRVCGKCGGDGKVSEWRNRTASEVECDECRGTGHIDEPATPSSLSARSVDPGEACSSFTTSRRSLKGRVLFTRTEDEEIGSSSPPSNASALLSAPARAEPDSTQPPQDVLASHSTDFTCSSSSRSSSTFGSADLLSNGAGAPCAPTMLPPQEHVLAAAPSVAGLALLPKGDAQGCCSEQPLTSHPRESPGAVPPEFSHIPALGIPAVQPELTPIVTVRARPGSLDGRDAAGSVASQGLAHAGEGLIGEAAEQPAPLVRRTLSLDVESVRARILVYKKERDEFEKELAEVSGPQDSHELMFEVLRRMRAQISHLENLLAQKARNSGPALPEHAADPPAGVPAPHPVRVSSAYPQRALGGAQRA